MTALKTYPLYLAGKPSFGNSTLKVESKYTHQAFAEIAMADEAMIEKAISQGEAATPLLEKLSSYERKQILLHCIQRFKARRQEFIDALCTEAGKPLSPAEVEFDRFIGTFELAAEETTRILGEVLPIDISPRAKGYTGFWKRFPIGLCLFITPFNFPINLVAHKIAAAMAVGCPFILKPALLTPVSAALIGEILAETDLPPGSFSILPCTNELAEKMVIDPRFHLLSFTGSAKVGWDLKTKAGKKQVVLELGGNAACIIDETSDLEDAAEKIKLGGYIFSGQSCISVQRIYVQQSVYETFKEKLLGKVKNLKCGDPRKKETTVGPLINNEAAIRIESWIKEAVNGGAKLLCGGKREGNFITPALLEQVPVDAKLNTEEVFGPVTILYPYTDFEEALDKVNQSRYGLQAGVFTRDLYRSQQAWNRLKVGGVIINDVSSWRSDNMPYGGVKDSGIGREGIKFAIEHLTEIRMLVIRGI